MPGGRPKGSKSSGDSLLAFARRIEQHILKAGDPETKDMERLVCRLMTNMKQPQIAAMMASKWVEWRYGKATEKHEHNVAVRITTDEADAIIRSYFIAASVGQDQTSDSDQSQAAQQDRKLLPS